MRTSSGSSIHPFIHPGLREFCCLKALGFFRHPLQYNVPAESPLATDSEAWNLAFSKQLVNRGWVDAQQIAQFLQRQHFVSRCHNPF